MGACKGQSPPWTLTLYIAGNSAKSVRAISNLRKVCSKYLQDNYDLRIIDLYKHPEVVKQEQILIVPTLVREFPQPVRRIVGDLSATDRVVSGLELENGTPIEKLA